MIRLENVTVSFNGEAVIENINLEIAEKESVVLIGPSGQGKSVLLKVIAGLIPPSSGNLFIDNKNFYELNKEEKNQLLFKMGMLFQKNALFDSLSVGENIGFPLRETRNMEESEIQDRIHTFLSDVDILHAKDLFPDEISGGMQKRLGIARALALDPQIILYDDPTAGLDPITSRRIIELILKLKKINNSTVVAITNDMNRAYQMANRIVMLVDKEIIVMESVEAAKSNKDPRVFQFLRGHTEGPLTVGANG